MLRHQLTSPLFLAVVLGSSAALAQGAPPGPMVPQPPPPGMTALPPGPGPAAQPPGPLPMQPPQPWQQPPPPQQVWQQQPPPPQGWQAAPQGYGASPQETPPPDTATGGAPLDMRGAIGLDTATFTDGDDAFTAVAIRLLASVPIARSLYLDARLPLGFTTDRTTNATLGNAMLGIRGVTSVGGGSTWISFGGGLGLPMLSGGTQRDKGYGGAQVPNAFWNIHEYFPSIVPLEARLAIEGETGPVTLRGELAPVIMIPIGNNDQIEVAVMHSIEAQIGHTIGGGLRLQGVALPTFEHTSNNSLAEGDLYQMAMEPFFVVQQPRFYFRTGMMLPLDKTLGPPLVGSFGFRLGFGVRLD